MQSNTESKTHEGNRQEFLTLPQRFGEIVSAIIITLILGFYLYQQFENTGFFTSGFGPWEMFAFYGSILLSLLPPLTRARFGRRNPVRPLETFTNIFFVFSMIFLLEVFPFDFAHFPDALPQAIRFMFWWLTNDVAKIAMVLAIFGGLISAGVNIVRYISYSGN
jgi:hypothetical protein